MYQDKLYFAASRNFGDNPIGRELFVFDPATGTTDLFADLNPGPDESSPSNLTVFDGFLYFTSYTTGIWRTDGTLEGTVLVSDTTFGSIGGVVEFNGDLYLSGDFGGDDLSGLLRIEGQGNEESPSAGDDNDAGAPPILPPTPNTKKGGKGIDYYYNNKGMSKGKGMSHRSMAKR